MRNLPIWALVGLLGCIGISLAQDVPPNDHPLATVIPGPAGFSELAQPASETAENSDAFYGDVEYLLRWFKPICLNVPIVTVGSPAAAVPGAIGQPGTRVVVGGVPPYKFEFGATSGMQYTLGWRLADGALAIEASGFVLERATASQAFVANSNGSPASYLPYTAPDNSKQAIPFTIPGVVTGNSFAIGHTHLWGLETNLRLPFSIDREDDWTVYGAFLIGARYLDLTDRDRVTNTLQLVADPSAVAIGADQFITRNQFAGPQLGGVFGLTWGNWSIECSSKLAAGITHQSRNIEGAPVLAATVLSPLLIPGPLLALPSNIGRETADRVTLVPEIGAKSRVALTEWCSVTMGYTLLYWNKVLCPGDQMDGQVNITQLPFHGPPTGPPSPQPMFVHTDYFTHGLDLGLRFTF